MSIRQKMILGAILITLIPITLISISLGYLSFSSAQESLQTEAQNKLVSIRNARKTQIEIYTDNLERILQTTAENQVTVKAMGEFKQAFNNFDYSSMDLNKASASVSDYYVSEFGEEYKLRNNGAAPEVDGMVRDLSDCGAG